MADLLAFSKLAAHERNLLARLYVAVRPEIWTPEIQKTVLREMLVAARDGQVDISFEDSDIGRNLTGLDESALSDAEYDMILNARTTHDYLGELVRIIRVCLNKSTSRRDLRKLCENVEDSLTVSEIENVDLSSTTLSLLAEKSVETQI